MDWAKSIRDGAANNKGGSQTDFCVTPKGDVIPATKEGFDSNLSQMKEVNGKYTGEGSNGPVRVEDAHPRDPDFIGHVSPDHYVPHVHIEYRVNGMTGPWGVGGNKISFPQEWLK